METLRALLDDQMRSKVTLSELDIEKHSLGNLRSWFKHIVLRFISFIALQDQPTGSDYLWAAAMETQLQKSFIKIWTQEFIQLIQEFPECTPCLEDLKKALAFCKMND